MQLFILEKGRLILVQLALFCFFAVSLSGCLLTKIVTVLMRAVGAVVSIIPVAGNTAHDAIDEAAEMIDEFPL